VELKVQGLAIPNSEHRRIKRNTSRAERRARAKPSGPFTWALPPRLDARHPPPAELAAEEDTETNLPLAKEGWVGGRMRYADSNGLEVPVLGEFLGVCAFPVKLYRIYASAELVDGNGFRYVHLDGM
jgi:hypothetical protein